MLLKFTSWIFLLLFVSSKAHSSNVQAKLCAECIDEVWEEVPCDSVYATSTTTTTTTEAPIKATTTTTTTAESIEKSSIGSAYAIAKTKVGGGATRNTDTIQNLSAHAIETGEPYKKCYFECKSGCKDFCRKVVLHPDVNKKILHVSKTTDPQEHGEVEMKQVLERNLIASSSEDASPKPCEQEEQEEQQQQSEEQPPKEKAPEVKYLDIAQPQLYSSIENYPNPQFDYANIFPQMPANYPLPTIVGDSYAPQSSLQSLYSALDGVPISVASYIEQQFSRNDIPKSPGNYATPSLNEPLTAYASAYTNPYGTIDAKASSSGSARATSIVSSNNAYKTSYSSGSSQSYYGPSKLISYPSSRAPRDIDNTAAELVGLENIEPAIDSYLRHFIYASPPKTQGYSQ